MSTKIICGTASTGIDFTGWMLGLPWTNGVTYTDNPSVIAYCSRSGFYTVTPGAPQASLDGSAAPEVFGDGGRTFVDPATKVGGALRDAASDTTGAYKPPASGVAPGLSRIGEVA